MGVSVDFFICIKLVYSVRILIRSEKFYEKNVSLYKYIYGMDFYCVLKFTLYYETLSWN